MIFDRLFLYLNGQLLGMADGGSLEFQGDPLPVDTLVQEYAGVTPVPKHCMISVESFVPTTGLEFDVVQKWIDTEELTARAQFGGSGKSVTLKAFCQGPSVKWGAAEHTKLSFKLTGGAQAFK